MDEAPPGARTARHSREEIRQLMMDAGRSILVERGLGAGAGELTFKRVFERIESTSGVRLTNASVIRRVWENQAQYQDDVLLSVALAGDTGGDMGETAAALLPALAEFDLSTVDGRLRGLTEVCRTGGAASLQALVGSRNWSVWVGVWVLGVTSPSSERGRRIRLALFEGYEATTDMWSELHGALLDHLGFRIRAPFTLRQFTVSVGALVEGCALRAGADQDGSVLERPTGPGGRPQEWTLFAVGLEALAMQYVELAPEWTGPAGSS
jgi:hypothetical protein